jgi:hypothetical protein
MIGSRKRANGALFFGWEWVVDDPKDFSRFPTTSSFSTSDRGHKVIEEKYKQVWHVSFEKLGAGRVRF